MKPENENAEKENEEEISAILPTFGTQWVSTRLSFILCVYKLLSFYSPAELFLELAG